MSKKHKLNTTRPEFLMNLMTGGDNDFDALTTSDMKRHICDNGHISYCVYTALMEANIDKHDIVSTNDDGESIAITFRSKKIAKSVRDMCKDAVVRYGESKYQVRMKVRDNHLIAEVSEVNPDEE